MNTDDRSHVDDATATLPHHDGNAGMDKVESRLQVDGNDCVPLLFGHAEHQSVLGDAGIVDQNVNTSELLLHGLDHVFGLCKICSIRSIAFGLHSFGGNFLLCFFVYCEVGECNVGTFLSKSQRDSLSDTACSTSDECCLTF